MKKIAGEFKVAIAGGDTVRSEKIVINVALLGEARKDDIVLRSGARPGDRIFVTGPLGQSLKTGHHLSFTPRIEESRYLVRNFKPAAMIDISDGLAADLGHILEQSAAGAVLYADQIPFVFGAKLKNALYDGEDYELLFTLPAAKARKLMSSKKNTGRFHHIGDIVAGKPVIRMIDEDGREEEIRGGGFKHF
jgi:thiamine-monophosphate kinase